MKPLSNKSRGAFSLAESMLALALTSIAGSAILLGIGGAVESTTEAMNRTIANGMAEQLVDEVMGGRYAAAGAGAYQVPLGPNTYETGGTGRERFDDTDDYTGFASQPAKDTYGVELGQGNDAGGLRHPNFRLASGYFSGWRQEIDVYYVNESNPSVKLTGNSTSNLRAVEVRIYCQDGNRGLSQMAKVRRVFAYVPTPQ